MSLRGAGFGFIALACCVAATAQQDVTTRPSKSRPSKRVVHKEANRMVKLLELPEQRRMATRRLLALGPLALPDLSRTLLDPRPEIAIAAMGILRMLGAVAKPALPRLEVLAKGGDAKIAFAARWAMARIRPVGITLVAEINKQRLVEFDAEGKVVLEIKGQTSIWDAERLPNGNYLICRGGSNKVHEIDRKGKVVWKWEKGRFPMDADPLPSGNVLVCDTNHKRVVEIDRSGKVVWEHKGLKMPYDADRLPSGNTLIADYGANRVLEVDPKGEVVWKIENQPNVLSVERLPNGNTLMALWSRSTVREVDRKGETVFEITKVSSPSSVQRLPNGNTLVGTRGAAIEYDAKRKVVRKFAIGNCGSVMRY